MLRRDNVLSAITNTNVVDVHTGEVREGVTIAFWGDEIEVVEEGLELRGATTIEINPDATPASSAVDLVIAGRAEDVLPRLERARKRSG